MKSNDLWPNETPAVNAAMNFSEWMWALKYTNGSSHNSCWRAK